MLRIAYCPNDKAEILRSYEAKGYRLVEDQIHFDGSWLVFKEPEKTPGKSNLFQRLARAFKGV